MSECHFIVRDSQVLDRLFHDLVRIRISKEAMNPRTQSLDVLRGAAVLLVICHHYATVDQSMLHIGGVGVELFFVLSGFLISGLLFSEIKETGAISMSRFFLRRGLKIYPAFYAFFLLTFVMTPPVQSSQIWSELLFLQSYRRHIWQHTWSLSVEEMFYVALPLLIVVLAKLRKLWLIPPLAFLLLVGCLAWRTQVSSKYFTEFHLRMDALFAGVAIGYCRHFRADLFYKLTRTRWMLPLGSILLLPCILLRRSPDVIYAFVLTSNALGFGCLVCWSQGTVHLKNRAMALIGRYSYSIYLWHMPVAMFWWIMNPMSILGFIGDLGSAIAIGILMAKIVELPALQLRETFVLSRSTRAAAPTRSDLGELYSPAS